jgi:hypothetical protein
MWLSCSTPFSPLVLWRSLPTFCCILCSVAEQELFVSSPVPAPAFKTFQLLQLCGFLFTQLLN